jgi:AbrB family looped-hinge helix DNA binding protein
MTIPDKVRKTLGWEEGDYLDIALKGQEVVLKKAKTAPKTEENGESWFLSEGWQKRHHEALKDIEERRVYGPFESAEDLLKSLRELNHESALH